MENGNKTTLTEPRGPWKAFAIAGFASGIAALSLFFIPYWGIVWGIQGIVLSALGKKSVVENGKASTGLVLSIIAVVLGVVAIILFYTVFITIMLSTSGNMNG